jgi:hypothetical protein
MQPECKGRTSAGHLGDRAGVGLFVKLNETNVREPML